MSNVNSSYSLSWDTAKSIAITVLRDDYLLLYENVNRTMEKTKLSPTQKDDLIKDRITLMAFEEILSYYGETL